MRRFDMHIHTEATAPYMKGDARLDQYHERGRLANLEFMGISDHYHYFWQKTRYVKHQREKVDASNFEHPWMYLGVEQTILDRSGRTGIRSDGLRQLDYVILAVHWMSFGGRLHRDEVARIVESPQKLARLVSLAKNYYENAMKSARLSTLPKIIGHPFNFLVHHLAARDALLDAVTWLCERCARYGVAYELNLDALPPDASNIPDHHLAYLQHVVSSLNDHSARVSLGSDAHKLENIGRIDPLLSMATRLGLHENLLLDDAFLHPK